MKELIKVVIKTNKETKTKIKMKMKKKITKIFRKKKNLLQHKIKKREIVVLL